MHVFLVGKYPPIQGGVSTQTYHAVQELIGRGHSVTVLTNAGDAEEGLGCMLTEEEEVRLAGMADGCETLRVVSVSAPRKNSYVPWAKPYLTLLYGAGLDLLADRHADVVFGWYLEPFGVAAALLARATGTPLALRAAGSDLGRLAEHVDLRAAYAASAAQASAILISGRSPAVTAKWKQLGVPEALLVQLQPCRLPRIFSPEGPKLSVDEVRDEAEAWLARRYPNSRLMRRLLAHRVCSSQTPVIGMYSKVGEIKGSFDLCHALARLVDRGVPFELRLLAPGKRDQLEELLACLEEMPALHRRTTILPPLAPWRIPDFIRGCDIICCLERRFPIAFHAPTLPREVLACGSLLMISEEVAAKQPFAESLVTHKNCIRIADPGDHLELTEQLAGLCEDRQRMAVIAKHGLYLSRTVEKLLPATNATANALEDIFGEVDPGTLARPC